MKYIIYLFLLFNSSLTFANYDYRKSLVIQFQVVALQNTIKNYENVIDPDDFLYIQERLNTIERYNLLYNPNYSCDLMDLEILRT